MEEFLGVNDTYITDYKGLRELGDQKMSSLVQVLAATTSDGVRGKSYTSHVNAALILLFILSSIMIHM